MRPTKSDRCSRLLLPTVAVLVGLFSAMPAAAADKDHQLDLGKFELTAPVSWDRKTPKSKIIAYEFAVPAAEGDEADGRVTVMAAGGGAKANLERWYGQFTQPDGGSTAERAKVDEKKIAGQKVYLVDISGTYLDKPAPFAPTTVEREAYRMLGGIIETPQGEIYIKFYGPKRTVESSRKAFVEMIEGLKSK